MYIYICIYMYITLYGICIIYTYVYDICIIYTYVHVCLNACRYVYMYVYTDKYIKDRGGLESRYSCFIGLKKSCKAVYMLNHLERLST